MEEIYQEGVQLISELTGLNNSYATTSSCNSSSTEPIDLNSNSSFCAWGNEINKIEHEFEIFDYIWTNVWFILSRLRYLFYIVWPTETMFPGLNYVPRYVAEMFPVFFVAAIFENSIRLLQGKNVVRINETVGSLSQGIFQECLRIKVRSIEVLMYCLVYENFRVTSLPWDSLWTWWFCYLAVDFGFYWAHRLAHEINFIWAIHQAHHSSEEFSIISALRQAVLQPFTAWFTYVPLALFIPPQIFLVHLQLSELYMAWIHTEIVDTIGPLEYILNTPSHHRVHHSRNPEYIDKNYGGMLIVWDRLFGTFKKEDKANPPVYGIVHPIESFNPLTVQFHPWPILWNRVKKANSLYRKFAIIFFGPGWAPNSPRLGDPTKIPKIVRPVKCYDPQISTWLNAYVVIHFGLILLFYHELTLFQYGFHPFILNVGVFGLVTSITTLGLILDNKQRYSTIYELVRCLLFLKFRHQLFPIIVHGLELTGLSFTSQMIVVFFINIFFTISTIIMTIQVLSKMLTDDLLWSQKMCSVNDVIKSLNRSKCKTT